MPIELHILAGSHAGRRLVLERPTITFGRDAGNDVVIDAPFVSRRHAELRFAEGRWHLVNHSPNGTRLNRRRVQDEPASIDEPATLSVGDEPVMQLAPQHAPAPAAVGQEESAAGGASGAAPGAGMSRRAKLWLGIGVYIVVMLGVLAFLFTLTEGEAGGGAAPPPELRRGEIRELLHRELEPRSADERRARRELHAARELFNRREAEVDARYRALEAYRLARAYMPEGELPEIDRRRQRLLEEELAERITERYERAYSLMRSRQPEAALRAFRELQRLYPAGANDPLLENIDRHAAVARRSVEGG